MDDIRKPTTTTRAEAKFREPSGSQIAELIVGLSHQPDIQRGAALFQQALADCAHIKLPDLDGMARSVDISQLPFSHYGDETMAIQLTSHVGSATAQGQVVMIVKGRLYMSVGNTGLVVDSALTQHLVAAAYAKLG